MYCSVLCLLCLCARLSICALWSPAGKGLTSWLSFVVSNFEFVTFPLVSWVRCSTWLYRYLIFAPLLTLQISSEARSGLIMTNSLVTQNHPKSLKICKTGQVEAILCMTVCGRCVTVCLFYTVDNLDRMRIDNHFPAAHTNFRLLFHLLLYFGSIWYKQVDPDQTGPFERLLP